MSTELSNGVIIPEEYSDDWYDEMSINLRKLNDVITAASDNATDIQRLDTDKANQSDLTALTSRVYQNETDIIALQTAVSGALKREIVQTLPTEDISTTTIYMIRNSESSGTNIYDEYMYINSQWELIGTSATDFSNYYTKNETDNLLSGKVDNSTLGSYYTKTESDNLLSAKANQTDLTSLSGRVTQNETDITALQTAVSGALKREIVQSLPTQDISTTTIYMIRNTTTSGDNIYDEYMYINNLWELIGTSATDFSNYYTKTEIDTLLSNKANDSDVVHKSGNENVNGTKTFSDDTYIKSLNFTSEVPSPSSSNGSVMPIITTITYGDSSPSVQARLNLRVTADGIKSLYPHENNQYALGLTSRKWSEVHGVTYYYGSSDTEFSDKFVTTDTAQTIEKNKTFTGVITINHAKGGIFQLTCPDLDNTIDVTGNWSEFISFNSVDGGQTVANKGAVGIRQFKNGKNFALLLAEGSETLYFGSKSNSDSTKALYPANSGICDLGTSTNKWKTFNGLNPGALSLPDLNNGIDISAYISVTGGQNVLSTYTAPADGWISINLGRTSGAIALLISNGSYSVSGRDITFPDAHRECPGILPVFKNDTVTILSNLADSVFWAYFYPCQGNV